MTRRKVDPTKILQYHSKGMTDEQLAEKFKCGVPTIKRYRRYLHLPKNTNHILPNIFTKEESDKIQGMYDKGWSDIKIVKRLHKQGVDVSLGGVQYWIKIKAQTDNITTEDYLSIKSEDSLFCNTEFLESYFKKPLSKKDCV